MPSESPVKTEFSVSQVIRYALTGGMAMLAYTTHCFRLTSLFAVTPEPGQLAIGTALATLFGIAVQSLHRALQYPLVLRPIAYALAAATSEAKFKGLGVRLDQARWQRRKDNTVAQEALDHWGDQVHFLYASASAILLSLLAANHLCPAPAGMDTGSLLAVAGTFYAAALIHDIRHTRAEIVTPSSAPATAGKTRA